MLTQDRCIVCAERVIGSEIVSDAPDGTPTVRGSSGSSFDVSQVDARFGRFGDNVNLDAR
jgi:hypothetical protein